MILPDGRLELVFHFASVPVGQWGAVVAGRMTSALELRSAGALDVLGVRLRPGAVAALLPCGELAGAEGMEGVLGRWAAVARERLGNASAGRLDLLWQLLRERLVARPDEAVLASVRRIERARGGGAVRAFVPDGLSERQWQRRFCAATGFAPKEFARLTRFQHLIALHQSGRWRRWAELALEAGFYDQAHLANEFRTFSGQSPEAFFRAGRGMAEFYRDGA